MLLALFTIFASVGLGTWLALGSSRDRALLGPIRTFALTAAVGAIVVHMMPESLARLGAWALLPFLLGATAPRLLESLGALVYRASHRDAGPNRFALEASYAGLLLHRVADGVGLGLYTGDQGKLVEHSGVLAALAGHAVPVVAIVVLTFDSVSGRGSALRRSVGLALASVVGVVLTQSSFAAAFLEANGLASAFVAGLLFHVVSHDLEAAPPTTFGERTFDALAALLGLSLGLAGELLVSHDHGGSEAEHGPLEVLAELLLLVGPPLLIGVALTALVVALRTSPSAPSASSEGSVLAGRGLGPEVGLTTWALGASLLGVAFASVRIVAAVGLALCVRFVLGRVSRGPSAGDAGEGSVLVSAAHEGAKSFARRFVQAFDEELELSAPWLVVGVLVAALLEGALPRESLRGVMSPEWMFLVAAVVGSVGYMHALAATPLVFVLGHAGLPRGVLLAGLLFGAALNFGALTRLVKERGLIALARYVPIVALASLLLAFGGGMVLGSLEDARFGAEAAASLVWRGLAYLTAGLVLHAVFRVGLRGFAAEVVGRHDHGHGEGSASHGHHGHAHG